MLDDSDDVECNWTLKPSGELSVNLVLDQYEAAIYGYVSRLRNKRVSYSESWSGSYLILDASRNGADFIQGMGGEVSECAYVVGWLSVAKLTNGSEMPKFPVFQKICSLDGLARNSATMAEEVVKNMREYGLIYDLHGESQRSEYRPLNSELKYEIVLNTTHLTLQIDRHLIPLPETNDAGIVTAFLIGCIDRASRYTVS